MTRQVRGWCPSAYRPMMMSDGLLVRVKPRLGRLTAKEALALADLAERFGSGVIDLTNRANLQVRGITEASHQSLLDGLVAEGMVDTDPGLETRRMLVASPFWRVGDETDQLARNLTARLAEFPNLPEKMGFAFDTGPDAILGGVSGDFRFERDGTGRFILRADGAETGALVSPSEAVDAALELARWFVDTDGPKAGRMSRHLAKESLPEAFQGVPARPQTPAPLPGATPIGQIIGVPTGSLTATPFRELVASTEATHIRITPWRSILLEDVENIAHSDFITSPDDPRLDLGAPFGTPQSAGTKVVSPAIARRVASFVTGAFELVRRGGTGDRALMTGRWPTHLTERLA